VPEIDKLLCIVAQEDEEFAGQLGGAEYGSWKTS
jgi:hypothetical protein